MKKGAKKIAFLGVLAALTAISYILESLLPSLIVPGARIGVANAFITVCLILYSMPEAFLLLLVKLAVSAAFGGASQLLFSAPAGIISLLVAFVMLKPLGKRFSVMASCVVAAVTHNLVQITVYSLVTSTPLFFYAAILTAIGSLSGAACGVAAYYLCAAGNKLLYSHSADNSEA